MQSVLIISNNIHGGGAEVSMHRLSIELAEAGFSVTIAHLDPIKYLNLRDQRIIYRSLSRTRKNLVKDCFQTSNNLRKLLKQHSFNLVLINCEFPELIAAINIFNLPKTILVEHTNAPWNFNTLLGRLVRSIIKLKKPHLVAVSDFPIWSFEKAKKNVIPNISCIEKATKKEGVGRIVFIGRLSLEKNPFLFLEIVKISALPALVIGDGNLASELNEYAKQENLNVKFLGFQSDPWINVMKNDLVLGTSHWEGEGMTIVEAIWADVGVLVVNNSSYRRLEMPNSNYFNDIQEAVAKIKFHMFSDPVLKLSNAERQSFLENRTNKVIVETWTKLFKLLTSYDK